MCYPPDTIVASRGTYRLGLSMGTQTPLHGAADEVAAAEAELEAAQERLDAARGKLASEQRASGQAAAYPEQPPTYYAAPGAPASPGYTVPNYSVPGSAPYPPPYGANPQQYAGYPQYQQPYTQQPYTQPVVNSKDHVAAGLLAIFLGWLGVHKFYLGYNTAGFIMLAVSIIGGIFTISLATWVMWIIAIIEGIMYLTKSQSEFEQLYTVNKHEWF